MNPIKPKFTPIAMKCNQEQFEAIKPKLEKAGLKLSFITDWYICGYLKNNNASSVGGICITNIREENKSDYGRTVYETWNEEIFLNACGIKTKNKTMKITKEQVKELDKGNTTVRALFPDVFKTKLEAGKLYKKPKFGQFLVCFEGVYGNSFDTGKNYGFNSNGEFLECLGVQEDTEYTEATYEEVFEALKNEAVKRGFAKDVWFKVPNSETISKCCAEPVLNPWNNQILYYGDYCIFKDGVWAEIIPTLTRKEAEEKLGVKIVD